MAYMTAAQRDRDGEWDQDQDRDRPVDRSRPQGGSRSSRFGEDSRFNRDSRFCRDSHVGPAPAPARDPAALRPGARASVAYGGGTPSIAAARRFTGAFLEGAAASGGPAVPPEVRSAAQLVVSELVTNACKFAPGPSVLTLEIRGPALEITVWDGEPSPPVVSAAQGAADPGRIGRHGLEIVLALCARFDVHREPVGKRVTATLDLLAPTPPGR